MAVNIGRHGSFQRKSAASRQGVAVLIAALLGLWWVSAADAQVAVDQFKPAPLPGDGFSLSRPVALGDLNWAASAVLDYAHNPLLYHRGNGQLIPVVKHQFVANLGFGVGLGKRFTLYAMLPVNLALSGQSAQGRVANADGAGLGDLALGGRLTLLDEKSFGVSAELTARLPTAEMTNSKQHYAGDAIGSYEPAVVAEYRKGPFDVRVRPGMRLRQTDRVGNLVFGQELLYGVAARYQVLEGLYAQLEGYGSTALNNFAIRELSPFEVLLGAKYQLRGWVVGAAGGAGVSSGYGCPDYRVITSLGYSPAR